VIKQRIIHRTTKKTGPGKHYPLGATLDNDGVNFALYSKHAKDVYLVLFDLPYGKTTDVIKLENRTQYIWHTFVYALKAGQAYGFRVNGDYDPANGMRFNVHKLLIDPYAKALSWRFVNEENLLLAYKAGSKYLDLSFDKRDNAHIVPKSIVVDDAFDWQGDKRPDIPPERLIIYETHLKGFTAHYSSRVSNPGTYLGFIEKIPHLKKLGITAVEFLPLQEFYHEDFLLEKGLKNYWGYNTIGFFAPASGYSTGASLGSQVNEFKTLVRELHKSGIEVIMDVVYNHTGEGSELGLTVCFRGIDNPTYYRLKGADTWPGRYYENYSGCGNCLNASDPYVIRFILDSLRYWVGVMHVDGFRFDLASVLGRGKEEFSATSPFFDVIGQDPALNNIRLIAEPWDLETYQVGNFPVEWSELNDKFRDTLRKFGKGDPGQISDLRYRLSGSPDIYGPDGRNAHNSINFITSHDGFTLNDLVSYNGKHNEANREDSRDGLNENNSWNCGIEGDTGNAEIVRLRKRLAKNYLCYLFFSSGVPMLLGGDEFMRSQSGNNNAYCQDNEISWFDWTFAQKNSDILRFCRELIATVKKNSALRVRHSSFGGALSGADRYRYEWMGENFEFSDWSDAGKRMLALYIYAQKEKRAQFFVIFNADYLSKHVKLPVPAPDKRWYRKIDTSLEGEDDIMADGKEVAIDPPGFYIVNARSTVLLIVQ